jgi:hypothetical protein
MDVVDGFDMTRFNKLRPTQVTMASRDFERRSDSATIFDVDFAGAVVEPETSRATLTTTGGRVDGIVQWLRFHVADGIVYDTGDGEAVSAFGVQYHAVEPFDTEPGQEITVAGAHDRRTTWFWVPEVEGD